MLVIEGKSGKSRVLAHYIDGLYKRTINSDLLIIDSVGISHVFGDRIDFCNLPKDVELKDFSKFYKDNWKSFQYTNYLILSLNAPKEILKDLKVIEEEYEKEIIVTVQNNKKDKVEVYKI